MKKNRKVSYLYKTYAAQKMKFSIKNLFGKCDHTTDLVTFAEDILNGKRHFFAVLMKLNGSRNVMHLPNLRFSSVFII